MAAGVQPGRAVTVLLQERRTCLADSDAACLRAIEVPGSPIAVLDSDTVVAGVDPQRVRTGAVTVRSVSGATATVAVGAATVLILRQDGVWLLRDVVVRDA